MLSHGHSLDPKAKLKLPTLAPGKLLELQAEVEAIGEGVLLALLKQIQPDSSTFEVHYVAPGYSGAAVFRVVTLNDTGRPVQTLLLKVSKESGKLGVELARSPAVADPSSGVYVPFVSSQVYYAGPWTAIAARFAGGAVTLHDWLRSSEATPDLATKLLSELFLYGLKESYALGDELVDATAISLILPQIGSLARIRRAIKSLAPLINRVGQPWNENVLLKFVVEDGCIGAHTTVAFPPGSIRCMSHGDLHSRNVLLRVQGASPSPMLIDPARRQVMHWASDPARLAADLWVSCIDGGVESAFWDSVPIWRESLHKWSIGEDAVDVLLSRNSTAWTAVKWVRDESIQAFSDHRAALRERWQFYLALVVELLHLTIYDSVPTPKRVFALLGAGDLLAQLEGDIPWQAL